LNNGKKKKIRRGYTAAAGIRLSKHQSVSYGN
jgi:hypothetical protein